MKELLEKVEKLKTTHVKQLIDTRIKEFEETGKKSYPSIFQELCFCVLTANFNAEKSIKIQDEAQDGFLLLQEKQLAGKLNKMGHRFPNARASYIVNARKHRNSLKDIVSSFNDERKLREWLVKNIKGFGYKEASHFLRNIGFKDIAIIDFHIVDVLVKHKLIQRPKALTKKKYLQIEELLEEIARKSSLNLAELDLYLWYMETGKVLK